MQNKNNSISKKSPRKLPKRSRMIFFAICFLSSFILVSLISSIFFSLFGDKTEEMNVCRISKKIVLTQSNLQNIQANIKNKETNCYEFEGISGQNIIINTTVPAILSMPNNNLRKLQVRGDSQYILPDTGVYTLKVTSSKKTEPYQILIGLSQENIAMSPPPSVISSPLPSNSVNLPSSRGTELSYNVKGLPPFNPDLKLQTIVDDILNMVQDQGLSTSSLSISLVNLTDANCCNYAYYSDNQPIFPASVTKLLWLVGLYGQYQAGVIPEGTVSEQDVYKMIQDSDNEPASRIVDVITATESGAELTSEELKTWTSKRLWINRFFESAGYRNINVSQKNFPIPYLKLDRPDRGRDLQIRGKNAVPIRNYLTSFDVARLLYEIDTGQAISKDYSLRIKNLLRRDLNPDVWKKKEYNSIAGFFAESLPQDSYVFSKVGWTSESRQDAAIIESPDGRVRYILVIFADSKGFSDDWKIFPNISQMVYRQMMNYSWN